MQEQDIYKQFDGDWLQASGEHYVAKHAATDFVRRLFQLDVRILGIEGFLLGQNSSKPKLDAIADYSSGPASEEEIGLYLQATMDKVTHYCFVLEAA